MPSAVVLFQDSFLLAKFGSLPVLVHARELKARAVMEQNGSWSLSLERN